jgi:hypothetical protein
VQCYSLLALIFEKDRLPALTAVAQEMSELRKDGYYIAGLWRKTLLSDLLWYLIAIRKGLTNEDDSQQSSLPSWSWVVIKAGVAWNTKGCIFFENIVVLDLQYRLYGASHVDRVRDAHITLQAPFVRVALSKTKTVGLHAGPHDRFGIRVDHCFLDSTSESPCEDGLLGTSNIELIVMLFNFQDARGSFQLKVMLHGLLLQEQTATGHFKRIGYTQLEATKYELFSPVLREFNADTPVREVTLV